MTSANSSLSTVVSKLMRASMGSTVSPDIKDEDLDRYVADLILKEAKQAEERYNGKDGIRAYLPHTGLPENNLPKTNKRFLHSIIRNVDDHNSAILRAQAKAAEEVRLQREEEERAERRARAVEASQERLRRLMGGGRRRSRERGWKEDKASSSHSRSSSSRHHRSSDDHRDRRYDDDDSVAEEREGYHRSWRRHDDRHREGESSSHSRHRSTRHERSERSSDRRSRSPKPSSSSTPSTKRRRISPEKEEHSGGHDQALPTASLHATPEPSTPDRPKSGGKAESERRSRRRSRSHSSERSHVRTGSHEASPDVEETLPNSRRHKRRRHSQSPSPNASQSRSHSHHHSQRLSRRHSRERSRTEKKRKRGASPLAHSADEAESVKLPAGSHSSKMDKYFDPAYDPMLDYEPVMDTNSFVQDGAFDGWNAMLQLVRLRREDKEDKKRREREGSSSSSKRKKSEKDPDLTDIVYKKRGAVREWDMGKETM